MHVSLTDEQANQLVALLGSLERWNRRINLTAIRKKEDMVSGHVLDSLAVLPFLHGDSVLDIGTGAGFPGFTPRRQPCTQTNRTFPGPPGRG